MQVQQLNLRPNSLRLLFLAFIFLSGCNSSYDPLEFESKQTGTPKELKDVGIDEKLSAKLSSLDISFKDESGKNRSLNSFLNKKRPVIISLVYYSCPSLCNLHLNAVLDSLNSLSLEAGKDYEFIAVSFDSKETSDLASAKKQTYIDAGKMPNKGKGIHFLTGTGASVKSLADAVGFSYKWDEKSKEWAHASAAVIVTPEGVVSRYLHGVHFESKTFRLSLVEASKGLVGDIIDSVVLFCFRYDPKANKYALYAFNLVRAGAGFAVLALLFWLVPVWLKNRRLERRHD